MTTSIATARLVEYRVTPDERARFERALEAMPDIHADPAAATRWLQRRFASLCSPELIDAILTVKNDPRVPGILMVQNGPQGPLPATPLSGDSRGTLLNMVEPGFLAGIMTQFGYPICENAQKRGSLVPDIVPRPGHSQSISNAGFGKALDLHIEDVHLPPGRRPTYVGLYCARPDPENKAETFVVDVRDALPGLSDAVLHELRQQNFVIKQSESFEGGPTNSDRVAILNGPDDMPEVIAEFNTTEALTPGATAALDIFKQTVRDHAISIKLQAGDLLVVCNRRVMHGRGPFEPKFEEGRDNRWLFRLSVVADPFVLRDEVAPASFRILDMRATELRDLITITAAAVAKIPVDRGALNVADVRSTLGRYDKWLNEVGSGSRPFAEALRLELALFAALEIAQGRLLADVVMMPVARIALATALVYHVEQEACLYRQRLAAKLPEVNIPLLRTGLAMPGNTPTLLMAQAVSSDWYF